MPRKSNDISLANPSSIETRAGKASFCADGAESKPIDVFCADRTGASGSAIRSKSLHIAKINTINIIFKKFALGIKIKKS